MVRAAAPGTPVIAMTVGLFLLIGSSPVLAQEATNREETVVVGPVTPIFIDKTLLDLPVAKLPDPDGEVRDINPRQLTNPAALFRPRRVLTPRPDPLLELQLQIAKRADRTFTTPDLNVAGMAPPCCPPDTVGEVGTTHFIQMMNGVGAGTNFQIFDKTTGAAIGPVRILEDLAPMGDACAGGDGDPIPLFDQLANRWVLTEFEVDTNHLCLYVSSGADPTTATWVLYRFDTPGPGFPDYPKYAVWPDAYYAATNDAGRVYAFDRTNMLAGNPASMQMRTVSPLPGFAFQITPPVDLGGPTEPPAGSPGIFIRQRDDEAHDFADTPDDDILEIFEFTPDFATPANTTFTGPTNITVADFDSDLCGLVSFTCIPQPGTPQLLDPLREPVMQRPVYRNLGTHQTLIGSFATDVGSDRAGIRWFELRRSAGTTTGGWTLFQEGTVSAADTMSRWMGSLAMDKEGNMALGYSTSGPDTGQFPSIRYTGRESGDPLGTMPQVEEEIVAGGASQDFSERWGDYSAMTVDPADDCTFWYTTEYTPSGGGGFPLTQIARFRFDSCTSCSVGDNDLTISNTTDNTPGVSYQACNSIHFGPNYQVGAAGIVTVQAPTVSLGNDVSISGVFSVDSSVP